ncbi:transposon Ty3-I Gag-Pol polyprotein [Trichonephila clavipes]|nr:transposon Ty3-I Gag-Pol polyprotein [Trichonephila clavipes]
MSTLDLRSVYFQLAINPRDIRKTAFVTKSGTYAFKWMIFGLKTIAIILKPVIGKFEAGLTLNQQKCHLTSEKLKYLGLMISHEGVRTDDSKVKAITEMKPRKNALGRIWEHRPGTQNLVADLLSSNPVESIAELKISCVRVLSSREQLIEEQRRDPELGPIYRYLENTEDRVQLKG